MEFSGFKGQYEETIHSNRFHSFHNVGLTIAIAAVYTHSVFVLIVYNKSFASLVTYYISKQN